MKKIVWCVTWNCPLSCIYCSSNFKNISPEFEMNTDTIPNLIDQMGESGIDNVTISGGEPLCRKDIFEIINLLTKHNIRTKIYSNGVLLTQKKCEELTKSGISQFIVSLDSIATSINDMIRGETKNVLQCLNLLLEIPDRNFEVWIHTVLTQLNIDYLEQLLSFCVEKGLDGWSFDIVALSRNHPFFTTLSLEALSKSKKQEYLRKLKQTMKSYNERIRIPSLKYYNSISKFLLDRCIPKDPCPAGKNRLVLLPGGDMFPCFPRLEHCLGNVKNQKLKPILEKGTLFWEENNKRRCFEIQCFRDIPQEYKFLNK